MFAHDQPNQVDLIKRGHHPNQRTRNDVAKLINHDAKGFRADANMEDSANLFAEFFRVFYTHAYNKGAFRRDNCSYEIKLILRRYIGIPSHGKEQPEYYDDDDDEINDNVDDYSGVIVKSEIWQNNVDIRAIFAHNNNLGVVVEVQRGIQRDVNGRIVAIEAIDHYFRRILTGAAKPAANRTIMLYFDVRNYQNHEISCYIWSVPDGNDGRKRQMERHFKVNYGNNGETVDIGQFHGFHIFSKNNYVYQFVNFGKTEVIWDPRANQQNGLELWRKYYTNQITNQIAFSALKQRLAQWDLYRLSVEQVTAANEQRRDIRLM